MKPLFSGEKRAQALDELIVAADNREELLAEAEYEKRIAAAEDLRHELQDAWLAADFVNDINELTQVLGSKWGENWEYPLAKRGMMPMTTTVAHPVKIGARVEEVSRSFPDKPHGISAIHGQFVMYRTPILSKRNDEIVERVRSYDENGFFVLLLSKDVLDVPQQIVAFGDLDASRWHSGAQKAIFVQELQKEYEDQAVKTSDALREGSSSPIFRSLGFGRSGVLRQNEHVFMDDLMSQLVIREQLREHMQRFIDRNISPTLTTNELQQRADEIANIARSVHEAHQGTALTAFDIAHAGLKKHVFEKNRKPHRSERTQQLLKPLHIESVWHKYFSRKRAEFPLVKSIPEAYYGAIGLGFGLGRRETNDALIELAGSLHGAALRERLQQPTTKEEIKQARQKNEHRFHESFKSLGRILDYSDEEL